jgi:hypothetical protein
MRSHFAKGTVVATVSAVRPFRLSVATLPCALPVGPGPSPPRGFDGYSGTRHTRQVAKPCGRSPARPSGRLPGRALPDRQEDRLAPHADNERGSFAMGFVSVQKLLCLTRKLRASANRQVAYVSRNAGKAIE